MKTEKFIVEIEMPDGDSASSSWLKEILQSDADIEDEGRWKVSVKKRWKPSEKQMKELYNVVIDKPYSSEVLGTLYNDLIKHYNYGKYNKRNG